jgi:hypothetical protein
MKNIHIILTDKPSRLWEDEFGVLRYGNESFFYESGCKWKNIVITSDEKIKRSDHVLYLEDNSIGKVNSLEDELNEEGDYLKKIILTTDQDLIADGVQAIDDAFLEWFVHNPSCEGVEIDLVAVNEFGSQITVNSYGFDKFIYKIIIPKEEPELICEHDIVTKFGVAECQNCGMEESEILKDKPKQEITINQFPSESVELFNKSNKSLGLINECQLLDIQCQIAEKRLEGYYVRMGDLKCEIDSCGELKDWDGVTFYREYVLLTKLRRIQQKHGK